MTAGWTFKSAEDWTFEPNASLDAKLLHAGFVHGREGVLQVGFLLRSEFPDGPDQVMARAEWLKRQPKPYVDEVVRLASRIETRSRP